MPKEWIITDGFGEIVSLEEGEATFKTRKAAEEAALRMADECDIEAADFTIFEAVAVATRPPSKIKQIKR